MTHITVVSIGARILFSHLLFIHPFNECLNVCKRKKELVSSFLWRYLKLTWEGEVSSTGIQMVNAAEMGLMKPLRISWTAANASFALDFFFPKLSRASTVLPTIITHLFFRSQVIYLFIYFCISQVEGFMVLITTEVVIYHLLGEK